MSTSTIWSFTTYVRGPSGMIPPIRRLVRLTNRFWITLRSFLHDMLQQTQLLSGYETGRVRGSFPEMRVGYVGWFPGKTHREFAPFLEGGFWAGFRGNYNKLMEMNSNGWNFQVVSFGKHTSGVFWGTWGQFQGAPVLRWGIKVQKGRVVASL